MIIENTFIVAVPPDQALDVLTDVPSIAPCIPGVTLGDGDNASGYRGTAAVRLGPVALTFAGEARIVAIDREAGTARIEAAGADQKGRGRASATVDFTLVPDDAGTRVEVHSDVTLIGAVAQYGRASGLIKEVANQIIADFTANLEAKLALHRRSGEGVADQAAPPGGAATQRRALSGFTLLFRALWAMIGRLFASRHGDGTR